MLINRTVNVFYLRNYIQFTAPTTLSSRYMHGERPSKEWAKSLVSNMSPEERYFVKSELKKFKNFKQSKGSTQNETPNEQEAIIPPLTKQQYRLIVIAQGIPFIGFGFLDNAIMIAAGEYIDYAFTSTMGFSTMAAAGLGNWVSDLAGIGTVGYVEKYAAAFGVKAPDLTPEQMDLPSARNAGLIGRVLGISIGCFLGMFPLAFSNHEEQQKEEESD